MKSVFIQATSIFTIDVINSQSVLRSLPGEKTTIERPLANKAGGGKEKMKLTYWTTLEEPRSCLRKVYPCRKEDFEPFLNGEFWLENVPIAGWDPVHNTATGVENIELRLALNKHKLDPETGTIDESRLETGEMDQVVYDVL